MSREWTIYVRDMITCCDHIVAYTEGVSREVFDQRGMVLRIALQALESQEP